MRMKQVMDEEHMNLEDGALAKLLRSSIISPSFYHSSFLRSHEA